MLEIQLMTVEQMKHYLSRFVVEARKKEVELSPMESMSSSVDKAPKRTKGAKRTWNSLTNG